MSSLNEFIASISTKGLMTTNRFRVEFTPPPIIRGLNVGNLKDVIMHCEGVTLPGMNISTTQSKSYGEFREMPYERLFDNITMTFMVDNDMDSKLLFDTWINSIQDPVTRQFNYYKEYTTDILIYVENKEDDARYVYKLFECYPKNIGQIQMDYASRDVMKLTVSMNYRYWTSDKVTQGKTGLIVNSAPISQNQTENDPYKDATQVYPRF